jgi:hypothetical protein
MPRKQNTQKLNRIRRHDDLLDDLDTLDELAKNQRIRKQPREERQPSGIKNVRRQRDKAWGRTINSVLRKRRKSEEHKP